MKEQLKVLPTPELIRLWNQLTGANVKRFSSRKAALTRFERAAADPATAAKLAEILNGKPIQVIVESKQGRVKVGGRAVKPENAQRVMNGEFLAGVLLAPPRQADALSGKSKKLNFNYKRKAVVKPLRADTDRAKLVAIMTKNGVTPEEVMKVFKMEYDAAVYRIRDLHYTSGHGLIMRDGRVYLND